MDIFEVIKSRRSLREYKDKPVSKEALRKMIDAARFAPTARGVEPWRFVVITDAAALKKLGGLIENARFLAQAKACIAVFCEDTKYYLEDGCAATQNILLAATALGIGSCWVAGDKKPYSSEVARSFNVPASLKLVSMIALGYPALEGSLKIKEKKTVSEILVWEKWTSGR